MATWGLVMETTVGAAERKHTEAYVLAHMTGTREEALLELERRARNHTPTHPWSQKRRRLFRKEDGFLLVIDGAWQSFSTRFTLAELLEDSAARKPDPEPEPEPEPEPTPEPEAEAADAPPAPARERRGTWRNGRQPAKPPAEEAEEYMERYADGVPVRPAWMDRTDLP
ncbi:hypothetical protein [Streptomyces sp. NPDC052042]|uniref:hypothetical protein n=1 Tax=Streptomyces sp. NPDC052042 TaxID=3365683 RepID=UPI0037D34895